MKGGLMLRNLGLCMALAALLAGNSACSKGSVQRYNLPNSKFPIALGVEIPAGKNIIFLSGMTPPVIDTTQPKDSPTAYGDTKTQTIGALTNIQNHLKDMGLSMGDVVKMQMFMVGDPAKGGKMDFAGMMEGYTQFFGTTAQPNLPTRTALQVASLANPGLFIEIEVAAVRP
jgi:enamine deaminase RidA (YjgF/YER057c/UK114 family)